MLTGTTDITWGNEIAVTQFHPPHMYLFLFPIALPGQYFFGVTTMKMSAAITTYLVSLAVTHLLDEFTRLTGPQEEG